MNPYKLRSGWSMMLGPVTFHARETFSSSVLPTEREVLERMIYFLVPRPKGNGFQNSKEWAAQMVAEELCEHWIWCNVYPKHEQTVSKQIMKSYKEFKALQATPKARMTEKWKEERVDPYVKALENGFDIRTPDKEYRKKQEEQFMVKETDEEEKFYLDQMKGDRVGYCDGFVDRKWIAMDKRRRRERESYERRMEEEHKELCSSKVPISDEYNDDADDDQMEVDVNYLPEEDTEDGSKRKMRKIVNESSSSNNGNLPEDWRHIRHTMRKVRPEFYTAVDRMCSELHTSREQAVGSVMIVAKEMFNIKWKGFNEDDKIIDLDTVPDMRNLRDQGKAREAMALAAIVEKIMDSEDKAVITYHDDGSKKQGAGSFSVQGITINGKFYLFPTLSLASETRENLASLKLVILSLLSAVSNVPSDILWNRITFTMTDSTIHNMEVDDMVAEALDTEHVPVHLLCQAHPASMFTREMQKVFKEVDQVLGPDKIFSTFAVTISEVQESVMEQWIDCVTRLVTHDFDHKSWNYADQFDIFIFPHKNPAKRLQKERFNSFIYTAMVVLWLDQHVREFLLKFSNITNSLACIVRSFEDLEYLRVLACAAVIIGVHLIEPYLSLVTSSNTTWEKLQSAFPTLYTDLTTTKAELLLDLTTPAFKFVSVERFQHCSYSSDLLQPTMNVIEQYRSDVVSTLNILLTRLAEGWSRQRGEVFGFGNIEPKESNSSLIKIKDIDQDNLKEAPVHNIDSERSVGKVNYELKLRGAKQLKLASSSMVKASASDLMEGKEVEKEHKKVSRKGGAIPEIIQKWEDKQKDLKKKGMDDKEIANISIDKQRNADLQNLIECGGPFTKPEQVEAYMKENINEKDRNKRLYIEVRHAKNSSTSFPKASDVFRLKKAGKNLDSSVYATNLSTYLGKVTCNVNTVIGDFREALEKLTSP